MLCTWISPPAHAFTDDKQLTGIIDWELAAIGDAAYDFANWRFWRPDIDSANQPRYPEILGNSVQVDYGSNFPERLRWAELRLGVRKMIWYTEQAQFDDSPRGMTDALRSTDFLRLAIERPLVEGTSTLHTLTG